LFRARRSVLARIAPRSSNSWFAASPTKNRCGILIFVSLAEHYARIIADEGIVLKVPNSEWQAAIDALISHIGRRFGAGLCHLSVGTVDLKLQRRLACSSSSVGIVWLQNISRIGDRMSSHLFPFET
jgi:hypothetical protein